MFLTSHVTVCVRHAELKGNLLTYLLTYGIEIRDQTRPATLYSTIY